MASDWIKMRTDLYRDPKVCAIADLLMDEDGKLAAYVNQNMQRDMTVTRNVMRNVTVGALVSVWGVMRHRGKRVDNDLRVSSATVAVVDDIADLPGFGDAMASVGWVVESDNSIVFPNFFEEMNVDPAEEMRVKNAERQRRFREKQAPARNVTVTLHSNAREEKRREEKKETPCGVPPRGEGDADSKPRQRNPLWDAIADGYFGGKVAPPDESRVGKLVRDLKALGAEPSEIPARRRKIRQRWKESADTPESLVKHWAELGPQIQPLATASTDTEEAARAERRAREQAEQAALAARLDRLDDLDHDTLEALKAKAVSAAPNDFTRRAFAAADPRTNRPLRVAMLTHVQETANA